MIGSTCIDHRHCADRVTSLEVNRRPCIREVRDGEIRFVDLLEDLVVDVVVVINEINPARGDTVSSEQRLKRLLVPLVRVAVTEPHRYKAPQSRRPTAFL